MTFCTNQPQNLTQKCPITSPTAIFFDKPAKHPYHYVNLERSPSFWDFYNQPVQLGDQYDYHLEYSVGKGKFAKVYKAQHLPTQETVALKVILNANEQKVRREIEILKELKDAPNSLALRDVLREVKDNKIKFALIFDYFPHTNYKELYPSLTKYQIKYFGYQTLRSLEYAHSRGIMHRDIKPLNVLMRTEPLELKVIDWGHSEYFLPDKEYSVRVASLHFKGPELILNYTQHDYSLDIWSTGCYIAGMAFQKIHFFQTKLRREKDPNLSEMENKWQVFRDHIDAIAQILGTVDLLRYADKFKESIIMENLREVGYHPKIHLSELINSFNAHLVDSTLIDLLEKMLVYDHTKRITAKEALEHPYFDEVRHHDENKE